MSSPTCHDMSATFPAKSREGVEFGRRPFVVIAVLTTSPAPSFAHIVLSLCRQDDTSTYARRPPPKKGNERINTRHGHPPPEKGEESRVDSQRYGMVWVIIIPLHVQAIEEDCNEGNLIIALV